MNKHATYQQLRGHLAYLKLTAAAEQLPAALESAEKTKPGYTQFLHDLLETAAGQTGTSALRAAAAALGCYPPFFDNNGTYRLKPGPLPRNRPTGARWTQGGCREADPPSYVAKRSSPRYLCAACWGIFRT